MSDVRESQNGIRIPDPGMPPYPDVIQIVAEFSLDPSALFCVSRTWHRAGMAAVRYIAVRWAEGPEGSEASVVESAVKRHYGKPMTRRLALAVWGVVREVQGALATAVVDALKEGLLSPHDGKLVTLNLLPNGSAIDVAPLALIPTLQTLALRGCREIKDVAALAGCKHLRELDLSHTLVKDMTPLALIPTLQTLALRYCLFIEVAALAGCTHLRELDLTGTLFIDMTPLALIPTLQTLALRGCRQIKDVAALGDCKHLRELDLTDTFVTDEELALLARTPMLEKLNVGGCANVSRIPEGFNLRVLDISNTRHIDMGCERFLKMPELRVLILNNHNRLTMDVAWKIMLLPSLRELSIVNTQVGSEVLNVLQLPERSTSVARGCPRLKLVRNAV